MVASGSPHLADATDLDRWADTRTSQADLPRLVRRLIRAENDQVLRLEMRGGEGVGLSGYDGLAEAGRSTPFVPDGDSVWEMGVGRDPQTKAQSDYRSRTDDPLGVDRANTTFVFVTPRRWEGKKDWEKRRREEGIWRDVRVLDADDIELALEVAPAVRVWLSEILGMEPDGATSIEDWWGRFSRGFDPELTPAVVLAGRADQAAVLLTRMSEDVGHTFIRAASVDDGLAFAACAMMSIAPEDAEPYLARSLLVHDGRTLRRLDRVASLLILLPYEEDLLRDATIVENHHVVCVITDPEGGDVHIELPPHDHLTLLRALEEGGVSEVDLDRYVRAGTKSLVALRRVATRFGHRDPESWSQFLSEQTIRRAWLAGSWNRARSGDDEVLAELCATSLDHLDERLRAATQQADPLFTRVGSTWAVASAEDSWRAVRGLLTDGDLDAVERMVQTVLGAVDPRLELPAEDRWAAAIHGKARVHSTSLRKGLARTLALIGTRGDDVRLPGGRTGREWSERVAFNLFARANEDATAQLWASISDVLPLLAEAAPDTFLRATSLATSGSKPIARSLFQDTAEGWNSSSPHTGLLWALESVGWSENYLGYVAEILATLAEIDPGGRLSNRPNASLLSLFRSWMPQTAASLPTRLQTLDTLTHRHPQIAWKLLLDLLPEPQEIGSYSNKPIFRDWATTAAPVTKSEQLAMVEAASTAVLKLATEVPSRWVDVVPKFDQLPIGAREEAIGAMSALAPEMGAEQSSALWDAVTAYVRRHREYADAWWSLGDDWLSQLDALAEALRPTQPQQSNRWIFDDWHPSIGVALDDFEHYEAALADRRVEAIRQILAAGGVGAVRVLATSVALPWEVGWALADATHDPAVDVEVLETLDAEERTSHQFSEGFARRRLNRSIHAVRPWLTIFKDRPLLQARLLQTVDVSDAWQELEVLGEAAQNAYWAEFSPLGRGHDFEYVTEAAVGLLDHGRAARALDFLSMYSSIGKAPLDVEVALRALDEFGTTDDPEESAVSSYDVNQLLDYLRTNGVPEDRIAMLEWRYLPMLHHDGGGKSLQRLLARDPQMFVQMVELAFKPATARNEDPMALSEEASARAANAFRLLRDWKIVPGTDERGIVDASELEEWVLEARRLLDESDRLEIGELQLGEVLAHAPEDPDGTFPTQPVRDLLESAPNDRLSRGFATGVFNKRGVTSRGMTDGGQQEYALAAKYAAWAEKVQATHPRTAAALRALADGYREDGRRNDEEVRRFLEGLDR